MTFEELQKLKRRTLVRIVRQPKREFLYGYFDAMPAQGTIMEVKSVKPSNHGGACVGVVTDSRIPFPWNFHSTDLEYLGELNRG